jgi:glycosyltransferase involved in cell wall biosynthesis
MRKLSVVIITYNEEKNIERCLRSVVEVADEIIVVDSFSKDRTKEICLKYNAKFIEHAFDGHIQQKNWAAAQASYSFVLSLDADEALDDELKHSIVEVKQFGTRDGYYMNRLTNYCGHWVRYSGWYPDKKLRLWDSTKGSWKGINPHDKFEMNEGDKVTGHIKGNILHYSYYEVSDHYRQMEYFTDIASKAYFDLKKKAPWFKLIINPVAKFISHFFLKAGFLDGMTGFRISRISAYATYLKYYKLRKLWNNSKFEIEN